MAEQRTFLPGTEWLYYKIYGGPKTIEKLLLRDLRHLTDDLLNEQIIDQFFFLRYTDPDYHLRIRFHLLDPSLTGQVMKRLSKLLTQPVHANIIWKVTIDTYVRELERYGSSHIIEIEKLFFYHSLAAVKIIEFASNTNEDNRWIWGAKYIDMILVAFNVSDVFKVNLFSIMSEAFLREFNADKHLRISLDMKYRAYSKNFGDILLKEVDSELVILNILNDNIRHHAKLITVITESIGQSGGVLELNKLLSSIIHMHVNRLFRTKQRVYEMTLSYFLHKFYTSEIAKHKFKIQKLTE